MKKLFLLLAAMAMVVPVLAQDEANNEAVTTPTASSEAVSTSGSETSEAKEAQASLPAEVSEAEDEKGEAYLTIEDQKAILDKKADELMNAAVTAEHAADAESTAGGSTYVVRIEVFARDKTSYIPFGDISLRDGFFVWMHDGYKQNGYAVFMYPAKTDESELEVPDGAYLLYGKSFHTADDAVAEVDGKKTRFRHLISYKPVVEQMANILKSAAYQGGK